MLNGILAFGMPGGFEFIIIIFFLGIGCLVPLGLVIWLVVSFGKAKSENRRLRVDIDRLTNELDSLRSHIEDHTTPQ